jgi:hypothetical protein
MNREGSRAQKGRRLVQKVSLQPTTSGNQTAVPALVRRHVAQWSQKISATSRAGVLAKRDVLGCDLDQGVGGGVTYVEHTLLDFSYRKMPSAGKYSEDHHEPAYHTGGNGAARFGIGHGLTTHRVCAEQFACRDVEAQSREIKI